jgi:hypothetical protein
MICALCKLREANKKNTHYLTDGIIRSCLNQDGSKEREKGLYFDLSNDSPFVKFSFQRNTSVEQIEDTLGRESSDDEQEEAKRIPFSVDNVFCNICEDIFSSIESGFSDILPLFRGTDLSQTDRVILADGTLVRLFFLIQVWRTSVCRDEVQLSEETAESLRLLILNHMEASPEAIGQFPLVVTYLETLGGEAEYTTNLVGLTNNRNPNLLFMNDFVIQFYERVESVIWFDFYGLNEGGTCHEFVNTAGSQFVIHVFHNEKRKQFIRDLLHAEKVQPSVAAYISLFVQRWKHVFGEEPSAQLKQEFVNEALISERALGVKYTKEQLLHSVMDFVNGRAGF